MDVRGEDLASLAEKGLERWVPAVLQDSSLALAVPNSLKIVILGG